MHDKTTRISTEMQITATSPKTDEHFLHLEESELLYELIHDPHSGPQCPWKKQDFTDLISDDHSNPSLVCIASLGTLRSTRC